MSRPKSPTRHLEPSDYATLADFRHEMRRFLAFSEDAAARAGLPPQQHQALLAIAGHVGDEPPSIGDLAERLLIAPHTAAELVARLTSAGLVARSPSPRDRRRVELRLTARASEILGGLTAAHLEELKTARPALARLLAELEGRERT